jgi:hypothetical protein
MKKNIKTYYIVTESGDRTSKDAMPTYVWREKNGQTSLYPTAEEAIGEIAKEIGNCCVVCGVDVETSTGDAEYIDNRTDAVNKVIKELTACKSTPWASITYSDDTVRVFTVNEVTF